MLLRRLLAAALPLGLAAAQVTTKCNPLERDDCPADPAFGAEQQWTFEREPADGLWETTAGTVQFSARDGAAFTIAKQGDSPTLRTKFYFFFGRTELWLRAAPGRGVISSMMWLSDDLDEVDWEFMGANSTYATSNYFAKGRPDFRNGGVHPMAGMQDDYHNYTTVWTRDQIDWHIDGQRVRTLRAVDANGGANYPQSPMRMGVGIWAGGDPSLPEGTRLWAGGDTDYAAGPYTMYMKMAKVTDFSSGSEYRYGDRSGSWQSIKIFGGKSTAATLLAQEPEKSVRERWHGLSRTTKIAVGSTVGGAGLLALAGLLFYFLRQRRIGAKEARLAEQRSRAERAEMTQFGHKAFDADAYSASRGAVAVAVRPARPRSDDDDNDSDSDSSSSRTAAGGASGRSHDSDSYHAPEMTTASPLGIGSWSGSVAGSVTSLNSPAARQSPRIGSPAPSAHGRNSHNALGFEFIPPLSPVRQQQPSRAGSPLAGPAVTRASTPLSRSQSPGLPPPGPLPSPRSQMRMDPVSRMASPALSMQSSPSGPASPERVMPDDRQGSQGGHL